MKIDKLANKTNSVVNNTTPTAKNGIAKKNKTINKPITNNTCTANIIKANSIETNHSFQNNFQALVKASQIPSPSTTAYTNAYFKTKLTITAKGTTIKKDNNVIPKTPIVLPSFIINKPENGKINIANTP